jgi:hypothetical protein
LRRSGTGRRAASCCIPAKYASSVSSVSKPVDLVGQVHLYLHSDRGWGTAGPNGVSRSGIPTASRPRCGWSCLLPPGKTIWHDVFVWPWRQPRGRPRG